MSKTEALNALKAGNQRFVRGLTNQSARQYPHQDKARLNETATRGQHPFATIIGCSDSRVPIEIVFDAGLGDIFPIRVAGNVSDVDEIGSIEYGVGHVLTPLMLVLGHTGCGAVTAVVEEAEVHGSIPELVDNIIPAVRRARSAHPSARGRQLVNYAVEENVWQSIDDLFRGSEEVRHLVSSGGLIVQGAVYHLETGAVEWLGEHPEQGALLSYSSGSAGHGGGEQVAAAHANAEPSHSEVSSGSTVHAAVSSGESSNTVWWLIGGLLATLAGVVFILTKTQWKLDNLKISAKIYVLSGIISAVFLVALFFTQSKMSSIGDGFTEIAELYIPLIERMSSITVGQLEQELAVQGMFLAEKNRQYAKMEEKEKEFDELAIRVEKEIRDAEKIIEEGKKFARNKEDLAYLEEALEHMKLIEREHADYDKHGDEIIAFLNAGEFRKAEALEGSLVTEGEELGHELEQFLANVEHRTDSLALVIESEEKSATTAVFVLSGIAIILALGISLFISKGITDPINASINMLRDIDEGEGDLTKRLNIQAQDEIGTMGGLFDSFIAKVQELIKQIGVSSGQVGSASTQISTASEQMASGAEEQQAQLSEVATTTEQMSAMILEASKNADETRESAQKTGKTAESGREIVSQTVTGFEKVAQTVERAAGQIESLSKRSEEIGNVIQVIDDIADQTNLLALNANIEAARAGDAGRGFAVVADEVRKLAERTVSATAEISSMIETIQGDIQAAVVSMADIQEQSKAGLELVGQSDQSLQEIASAITGVVTAVEQIATSTNEQSSGAEEISKNIEGVTT
ncbi:MAG: hypothetical protein IIA60_03065, partial [Candidatus Marinimicrobia bacterium]|nr:hypothetical protein [Candidatus Neomarinimicrobiota bacterium]